jgi:hypothetical protein
LYRSVKAEALVKQQLKTHIDWLKASSFLPLASDGWLMVNAQGQTY